MSRAANSYRGPRRNSAREIHGLNAWKVITSQDRLALTGQAMMMQGRRSQPIAPPPPRKPLNTPYRRHLRPSQADQSMVGNMTNWQRKRWAGAGYPEKDDQVQVYLDLPRRIRATAYVEPK